MYEVSDIDDYRNRLTEEQKKAVIKHCNRYEIKPKICAWYNDWEDFCSDWCSDNIGYTRTEARRLLHGGQGEFMIFKDKQIVRFAI